MRNSMKSILAALVLATPLALASCEGALDDVLGEWSRPIPGNNNNTNTTPSTTIEYVEYTVSGTTASPSTKSLAEGEYTAIASGLTSLSADKPYVVNDDITLDGNVTLTGDAKIILCDGKTLTINGYLGEAPAAPTHSLLIYGQTGQTGKLIVKTTDGNYPIRVYDLKIHGGDISSKDVGTGNDTQGIYTEHDFDIYNGKIEAFGTMEGVMVNVGGTLTTYGGSLEATTSVSSWSAGQGSVAIMGTIIMNGGAITATGGDATATSTKAGGDAIDGTLTVNGGTLTATGGAGDGTGYGGAGIAGIATFDGGTITAKGIENSAINPSGAININNGITSVTLISTAATANPASSTNWIALGSGSLSFGGTDISGGWVSTSFADPEASHQYSTTTIAVERDGTSLILTKYVAP